MHRKVLTMAALTIVATFLAGSTVTSGQADDTRVTVTANPVTILTLTTTEETRITRTITTLTNTPSGETVLAETVETTPVDYSDPTLESTAGTTIGGDTGPTVEVTGARTGTGGLPAVTQYDLETSAVQLVGEGIKLLTQLAPSG